MPLVTLALDGPVATLTLNDPERLNAMSVAMGREFKNSVRCLGRDKNIRVVILTGAGRAFSSGGNLDMIAAMVGKPQVRTANQLKTFYKMYLSVRYIPQPVIAAINGAAMGAGFCLALACDLRVAAHGAKMGANFARLGLAPGMAGTSLITRLAGPTAAAEILLTGKIFTAEEALRYNLINETVAPESLLSRARELAQTIAGNAPLAVAKIRQGIRLAQNSTLENMFDYDAKAQAQCLNTSDILEGIAAVKEKRTPRFSL